MEKTGVQIPVRMEAVKTVVCPLGRGTGPPWQSPTTHVGLGKESSPKPRARPIILLCPPSSQPPSLVLLRQQHPLQAFIRVRNSGSVFNLKCVVQHCDPDTKSRMSLAWLLAPLRPCSISFCSPDSSILRPCSFPVLGPPRPSVFLNPVTTGSMPCSAGAPDGPPGRAAEHLPPWPPYSVPRTNPNSSLPEPTGLRPGLEIERDLSRVLPTCWALRVREQ